MGQKPVCARTIAVAVVLLAITFVARAQTEAVSLTRPEPTGSVAGHVFCSDTNEPARFARVWLEAIPDTAKDGAKATSKAKEGGSLSNSRPGSSVETTLDGSFVLTKVKPGNYYVVVEKDGYVKPREIFTKKQIDDPSPEMRALIASALPQVTVQGGHTEQAEVRLERGGAISGTILYDDGSPAADLNIQLLHKDSSGKWVPPGSDEFRVRASTDDRGYFRVSSLLGDEYMVEATLVLSSSKTVRSDPGGGDHVMEFAMMDIVFSLPFYGAGFARQSQAASVKLHAGQELSGQDMSIPISKLHKLTGRVAAGHDGHLVNAAKVALVTRDDNKELSSTEVSREDGLFHFEFIPDGDYILRITEARDVVWEAPAPPATGSSFPMMLFPAQDKERVIASYGGVDQTLLFSGDTLGVTVTVPPDAKPDTTAAAAN